VTTDPEDRGAFAPFGDGAARARLPGPVDARAVQEALRAVPGVVDAVVTEQHAMVTFHASPRAADLERALHASAAAVPPRVHRIPVRYDGEDLGDVARATGLPVDAVIAAHTASEYTVAAVGFLPGFAYLTGLDARLSIPRRAAPRPRVPALSVAIAGPYAGVYPFASPGGWHLLGAALGFAPFDAARGATLALGDRVRFERAGA
jgi:UPF0271 protein